LKSVWWCWWSLPTTHQGWSIELGNRRACHMSSLLIWFRSRYVHVSFSMILNLLGPLKLMIPEIHPKSSPLPHAPQEQNEEALLYMICLVRLQGRLHSSFNIYDMSSAFLGFFFFGHSYYCALHGFV
jgi:hypothetical protein